MSFKLTSKQEKALDLLGGVQHGLLEGGSRSGKTFIICRSIAVRGLASSGSRHAIFRLHFNSVKASIVYDTWPKMMALCFPDVSWDLNKSDWFVTLPNGSQIWFGGLDDKDRTEKILGQEYATIAFNEVSQIPYSSRNIAITRLAQNCFYDRDGVKVPLRLKAFYDCNPPSKAHWAYKLFHEGIDPESKKPIANSHEYGYFRINPQDNQENLPPDYIKSLEALPVRLRKRFLEGEYSEVAPGALWTDELIDQCTVDEAPQMVRVIVAVDPSGADDQENSDNDEIGIIVAGLGMDGRCYILEDLTVKAGPAKWGEVVVRAYERHEADRIVAETNYGGEMVKFVVQSAKPGVPFKKVTASRGKAVRAEPISALTEQGKVRFVGKLPQLEDELCAFTTAGFQGERSPNRADAFVWAVSELFPGLAKKESRKPKPVNVPQFVSSNSWLAA